MPYKIVQTMERGKLLLTSIPDTWEKEGILYWPKKHADKFKINGNVPQPNWYQSNCIVKRKNILSLEEAEKEIQTMLDHSDTEEPYENVDPRPSKKKRRFQPAPFSEDFNNLVQQCVEGHYEETACLEPLTSNSQKSVPTPSSVSHREQLFTKDFYTGKNSASKMASGEAMVLNPEPTFHETMYPSENPTTSVSTFEPVDSHETLYYTLETDTPQKPPEKTGIDALSEKIDNILTQYPAIMENQKLILNNQQLLSENQQIIILKFAEISTQFEELIKQCSPVLKQQNEVDFEVIENKEQADKLETKLKDATFKADLDKKFSVVCGKERGKGINNSYILIDLIFSREFLKQCSWAGGSRTAGKEKICFRAYTRIFDFFFGLIKMTDSDFTKELLKTFFKNILRNSESRSKSKQIRASTSRNRPRSMNPRLKNVAIPEKPQIPSEENVPNVSEEKGDDKENAHKEAEKKYSSDEEGLC